MTPATNVNNGTHLRVKSPSRTFPIPPPSTYTHRTDPPTTPPPQYHRHHHHRHHPTPTYASISNSKAMPTRNGADFSPLSIPPSDRTSKDPPKEDRDEKCVPGMEKRQMDRIMRSPAYQELLSNGIDATNADDLVKAEIKLWNVRNQPVPRKGIFKGGMEGSHLLAFCEEKTRGTLSAQADRLSAPKGSGQQGRGWDRAESPGAVWK